MNDRLKKIDCVKKYNVCVSNTHEYLMYEYEYLIPQNMSTRISDFNSLPNEMKNSFFFSNGTYWR